MFDAHIGEINLTLLVIVLSIVLVLPMQYWLCRRERALFVRLLPAIVFALGGVVCVYLAYSTADWDALFYVLFAIYCGLLLAASALGWAVWGGRCMAKAARKIGRVSLSARRLMAARCDGRLCTAAKRAVVGWFA